MLVRQPVRRVDGVRVAMMMMNMAVGVIDGTTPRLSVSRSWKKQRNQHQNKDREVLYRTVVREQS